MSTMRMRSRAGFALRDLLVVAFLLVIAVGLLLSATRKASDTDWRVATMNSLSQCAKAVLLAHDNNKKYPPYYGTYGGKTAPFTFHVHLLPFVDAGQLYRQDSPRVTAAVPAYVSTMDPTPGDFDGACNFVVNLRLYYTEGGLGTLSAGADLIYPRLAKTFAKDGTENTLLFATKYHHCGANGGSMWMDPGNNAIGSPMAATFGASMQLWQAAPTQAQCDPTVGTAVSFTPSSIQIAMCDASTRSVARGISQATWQAAHTPNAGDTLGTDWEN
jgi:hypothetical protein